MKTEIQIIGAGMAGLLCATMLRRHKIIVLEKQDDLPNNHHAVLRFRSDEIGKILGVPFKKVNMIKTYIPYKNMVADSLSYAKKCTGKYSSDRSIIAGTIQAERYIAPEYLISNMEEDVDVSYNTEYIPNEIKTISTIPMPTLMSLLNYKQNNKFEYIPGIVFTGAVPDCDAYVSVLNPGPESWSRATITGDKLMIEYPSLKEIPNEMDVAHAYWQLGLSDSAIHDTEFKQQKYFKIIEIDEAERKKFLRYATVQHGIYSLGRYATWRPRLLLDDLVKDIHKIEGWICK